MRQPWKPASGLRFLLLRRCGLGDHARGVKRGTDDSGRCPQAIHSHGGGPVKRTLLWLAVGAAAVAATGSFGTSGGEAMTTFSATGKAGPSAPSGSAAAKADCSMATATRLANQHRLNNFLLPNPIRQLLCGPFTGPGSEAMAITIGAPTCWPVQGWAVFSFSDGDWRLVLSQRLVFVVPPLVAVGGDIRETRPVYRRGDPRCIPSGGTHARTWHWDGTRFAAGPWKQVKPPAAPAGGAKSGHFKTPSGNIVCVYSATGVLCGIKSGLKPKPPYTRECRRIGLDHNADRISLGATGRADPIACSGDAGPFVGERSAPVLAYGKTWNRGGLRCRSAFAGLTCRNKSGHGFFLSRARWRRF